LLKQILTVIKKDLILEWRNKFTAAGVLVQVLTAVFIVYLSVPVMNLFVQNSLFWIILSFTSINAIAKGFLGIDAKLANYYAQLVPAKVAIYAQLIYNILLMAAITIIIWIVYNFLINGFQGNNVLYLITVLITGVGFASAFTLMSALVRTVNNAFLIAPVISMPIIIPQLMLGMNSSRKALDGLATSIIVKEWLIIGMLSLFSVVMTIMLYSILEKKR
jgi:heme exporter protein B